MFIIPQIIHPQTNATDTNRVLLPATTPTIRQYVEEGFLDNPKDPYFLRYTVHAFEYGLKIQVLC